MLRPEPSWARPADASRMQVKRRAVLTLSMMFLSLALAGCASEEQATEPNLEDNRGIDAGEDDFGPGASPAPGHNESEDGQEGLLPPP